MNKQLVISKGYTLEVRSWENDGDHGSTHKMTVQSKELAKTIYDLMQLCRSKNNPRKGQVGLGNTCDEFSESQKEAIINFFKENPILVKEYFEEDPESITDESDYIDMFYEIAGTILGSSEYYACRVMESCKVTYSTEDIYLEIIEF